MSFNFKNLKKTFLLFIPYIIHNKESRKRIGFSAGLILLDVIAASVIPYFSKLIVDSLANNIAGNIVVLVLLLGFFWILEKTLSHLQDIIFFPVINSAIRDLNRDVIRHIHHLSMPDYQKLSIPEIINCTRRISISARSFIKIFFLLMIPTSIKLIIATSVTIKLGLFGLALLPAILLAGIILYKGTQWYAAAREAAWQMSDKVISRVNDSILNSKITRFSYPYEIGQVSALLNTEASFWYKTNTRLHTIHVLISVLLGVAITGILLSVVFAIQNHTLTIGDFVFIKGQLLAAFLPLKILAVEFRQLVESIIDIKKIIQLFEMPLEKTFSTLPPLITTSKSSIVLKNVCFSHSPENLVFNQLSLQIEAGTKLGIIGESGSGKSSLINLIASLYKPSAGNIFIKGQNINTFSKEQLHQLIHLIPQDLRLFNMSLRENILYGINPATVSESRLLKIAEQVRLLDLLNKLPNGLDTLVGEMGANLSGGEKQKVVLARALLIKPEILLLDETTHSLDIECEKVILNTLFLTIPTVIIVSHKASTLNHLNKIIKIQEGKLYEIDISSSLGNYSTVNNITPVPA
jgi:ABC-type multidrug transport system fused ATPase/permease subunit